ncbi:hypothetical protein A45J_2013 [hot springs metagenome]|uniref:Uncharacterized protein n=1 Tax=hot springs metagenome TaxID=433727 RepID=A0A5J4L3L5_9ZZZZ
MEVKKSISFIVFFVVIFFFIIFSVILVEAKIPDFAQKQEKAIVAISIYDKNGVEIASESGFIVDSNGIIATNCKIISQWLEDVEYVLIVRIEDKGSYPINKLISYNRRHDIALFEIKADGLIAVNIPSDFKLSDYIKRQIALHKKFSKKEPTPKKSIETPQVETPIPLKTEPEKLLEVPFGTKKSTRKLEEKKDNPDEYFIKGLKYESVKQYANAIEAYRKTLKIKPDHIDAHANLGMIYYKLGRYSDAINAYKQALKIKPDVQALYNKLGTVYIITGKYSEAIDVFEQALGINSRNPNTHFNLGIAYYLNGDKDAAYEEYIILNKLDTSRAEELFDLLYR